MGTRAWRTIILACMAVACAAPAAAWQKKGSVAPPQQHARPLIKGGHDKAAAWMTAEFRGLAVSKHTVKASRQFAIELRAAGDAVTVTIAPRRVAVARGSRTIVVDSPEALAKVQELIGGSPAVFASRAMLSELESKSDLSAPDMALLGSAAFISALGGDIEAPRRLADRFVQKHRGIYRQVRLESKCWDTYSTEVTAAWNELQACMADADNRGFLWAAYERLACNAIWLLRSESAWLEYLNCLGPMGAFVQ